MLNLQRLYVTSPLIVKNIFGLLLRPLPRKFIFGALYRKTLKEIEKHEFNSYNILDDLIFHRLKNIVTYSYENVPYYKKLFKSNSINPNDIKKISDFQLIPFLDKNIVKNNFNLLKSKSFNQALADYGTTGGTSGEPLGLLLEKSRSSIEWAFLTHIWKRIGYSINDRRLVLRGEVIKQKNGKLHFYDSLLNQLSISTFHMSEHHLKEHFKLIEKFKPHIIHGYPSAITTLCQFMSSKNLKFDFNIKGVVGISENIIPAQKKFIEKTLNTRFFTFYGHSEKLILGSNCEYSNTFHFEPLYGFVELVDNNGNKISKEGQVGELVGTGFNNKAMPLIRYKTGDLAVYTNQKCKCGREYFTVREIKGRWLQEMLVTKNNSLISITALNLHSNVFDRVQKFQFEQNKPGIANLNIIPKHNYKADDGNAIINELNLKLDNQIDIYLKKVKEIPSTPAGKSLFLNQKIVIDIPFNNIY